MQTLTHTFSTSGQKYNMKISEGKSKYIYTTRNYKTTIRPIHSPIHPKRKDENENTCKNITKIPLDRKNKRKPNNGMKCEKQLKMDG